MGEDITVRPWREGHPTQNIILMAESSPFRVGQKVASIVAHTPIPDSMLMLVLETGTVGW